MPQDAFTLRYVIRELDEKLRGGKISRINQPERDELTLFIYTGNGTVKLEICAHAQNCRINICSGEKTAPKTAPGFCMLLRKYIQNASIVSVTQPGFERIAHFKLRCSNEFEAADRSLYCEIMGKYSNVVLVQDGKILGAMKTTSLEMGAKRLLFPGAEYKLPEAQQKTNPDNAHELRNIFSSFGCGDYDADFLASKIAGISYSTALDIELAYGGNVNAESVHEYINGKFFSPCVTYKDGCPDDFKACCFSTEKKLYPSLLEAQSAYYGYIVKKKAFDYKKRRLLNAVSAAEKKCAKRLSLILSRLDECRDIEDVKLKGELITANIYAIERQSRKLVCVNYYDEDLPEIEISLDPHLTPAQNAQKYYKRYAKLKRTAQALFKQKEDAEKEKYYLESILCALETADEAEDLDETETELELCGVLKPSGAPASGAKGRKQDEKTPFRHYEYAGFTILAGRNNMQNERLKKSLSGDDVWLHTQKYHSAHVAVLSRGKSVPDDVIKIAAQICAYYSEARDGDKIPVDYTLAKFVKKPSGAKPGFVVYTDHKTALAAPNSHEELRQGLK